MTDETPMDAEKLSPTQRSALFLNLCNVLHAKDEFDTVVEALFVQNEGAAMQLYGALDTYEGDEADDDSSGDDEPFDEDDSDDDQTVEEGDESDEELPLA